MKISVVVPVYNAQKYLCECIDSVINQSYENWELILVDDGSQDESAAICDKYEKKYPGQIKVVHQANSGQIISRVEGMRCASGDYYVFLDADDLLTKKALEKIVETIDQCSPDILVYNGCYMSESGEVGETIHPDICCAPFRYSEEIKAFVQTECVKGRRFNYIWLKAFKRECVSLDLDYRPYTYMRLEEDLLMQLPYFDQAKTIRYLPECLYLYRDASGSISKQFRMEMYQSIVLINKALRFFGEKWKVEDWDNICRQRFLRDVIAVIKQMAAVKDAMSDAERIKYLRMMRNDTYLKANSGRFWKGMTIKQRLVLFLLMCRGYRLLLLVSRKG